MIPFVESGLIPSFSGELTTVSAIIIAVITYLLGSVTFAIIIAKRMENMDIREYGSGNAGASNITRTVGPKAGAMTLFGDGAKGVVCGLIGYFIGGPNGLLIAGVFAFIGHCFPLYYGFRGGKGVATYAGIALSVDWRMFIMFLLLWGTTCVVIRMMGLGAIVGGMTCLVGWFLWYRDWDNYLFYSIFLWLFIIYNHRTNVARMLRGTEPKATLKTHKKEEKYK